MPFCDATLTTVLARSPSGAGECSVSCIVEHAACRVTGSLSAAERNQHVGFLMQS